MDPPEEKRKDLLPEGRIIKTFVLRLHATTKGTYFVRILGVCAGLGLVVSSLFICEDWIELRRFDVAELLTAVVSIVWGLVGMLLETNTLFDIGNAKRGIISFAPSLERVSGRGFMYICCGTLQVLVRLSVFMLSGSFALAAGGFMVYTGQQAEKKLDILKRVLSDDESILVELFSKKDSNSDGILERWEFDRLIASMYLKLNDEELKAAFDAIDGNEDNKITYDEFRCWVRDITAGLAVPTETFYNNGYEV
jgi:hypothetical protein